MSKDKVISEPEIRTQFDDLVEDFLEFSVDHVSSHSTLPVQGEPFQVSSPREELIRKNREFLLKSIAESPIIDMGRPKPDPRAFAKRMVRILSDDSSAAGWEESQRAWAKRMGLPTIEQLAKLDPTVCPERHTRDDRDHSSTQRILLRLAPAELLQVQAAVCLELDLEELPDALMASTMEREVRADRLAHRHTGRVTPDVDGPSVVDLKLFRWNNPEGYEQYVAELKEEMGVHFNESLVLPEWKGPAGKDFPVGQRPSQNPDDLDYIGDDAAEDLDGWHEPSVEFGTEPDADTRGDF